MTTRHLLAAALTLALAAPAAAQSFPTDDPVIRAMWAEGMTERSQAYRLAQVLTDSIGPRLNNSPGHHNAMDWALKQFTAWGVPARREQYGTWRSWRRGRTHADLITPRFRTLEATMLGWSPGTNGPVEGDIVLLPDAADSAAFAALLPSLRGKFVATSLAEPTCRPDANWEELARPASVTRMRAERDTARREWQARARRAGGGLVPRLEAAGVAGVLSNTWSAGWGVDKIFTASTQRVPAVHLSCEDYGLVFRLAQNGQGPRLRLDADAEFLGEQPVFNVIAEVRGSTLPDEYVVLSAHLDSFDSASGATDNATGTITMMEAMRILKATYPNPKRTIIVGLWAGEEQGLVGSAAFAADHPEVIDGLQAAFNQDNGTWRIDYIRMQGFAEAGASFGRWFGKIPGEITDNIRLDVPGIPETGGSDHMSFICRGVPGFRLQSHYPDYRQYTWHTNRDTFDKIIMDDLRNNATLTAMLAYLASEDPERVSRTKRELPGNWPRCGTPRRSTSGG
ncbi:MAG TPA: M20/M25/M40 family metallo-hydrolase [Longimicrobiales bacterium]|nr:M20/M25/M40 family metallo-hydrolase [Longimicrobiales bacterium]